MKKRWYQKTWVKVIGAIFALAILSDMLAGGTDKKTAVKFEQVEEKLPSLQMAEIKATRYLKESMKDPDSFEKINADTGYLSDYKGDTTDAPYLYANIRYRAKNSFGGYVIEKRSVVMKSDFSPLEIFESK